MEIIGTQDIELDKIKRALDAEIKNNSKLVDKLLEKDKILNTNKEEMNKLN